MKLLAFSLAIATAAFAGGVERSNLYGEYVEARTADVFTGPCFANAEINLMGNLAVFGWRIAKGKFEGVALDGLGVIGVVRASATLGDVTTSAYPVKSVLIVDERANAEQRIALQKFAKRMGGDLLQDVAKVYYMPVDLTVENNNIHSAKATLKAGELAEITTRAIGGGDHICANEEVWYSPLTKLDHAMPAYALNHEYRGEGLDTRWSSPGKRSAFVGTFHLND
ncbi:MAG: DUF1326 domain-containing protein [Bryobacteraceae bacterium]|nr:DUF1326 domain-containing protein [Bryobacteraceae bacterium]MDW8376939.1 DUF1326 domain-containing protein [Bryobacterales bacterium]